MPYIIRINNIRRLIFINNYKDVQYKRPWLQYPFPTKTMFLVITDPACWPERWSLPRQTWIDVCATSTSVLRHDPPQEPAKEQSGAAAADRTPTPKSMTESPNTKSNTQELSRNREPVLSHSILKNSQA